MKWILIDFSYLSHRAMHSTKGLEFEDIPTGVMFGFWEQLIDICTNPLINSNKIVLFGDSKKSYRRKLYPGYKHKRYENRTEEQIKELESMYEQMNILRKEVFPEVGLPFHRQVGLESDDLLAYAARKLTEEKEECVIITSDADLYQCITDYASWFDPQRNKYVTPEELKNLKGVGPEQWAEVKAIGGCNSDCIPGIVGVSEKSAVDFLHGKLPNHYKKYKDIVSNEGKKTIEYTRELVTLPHVKTKAFTLEEPAYNAEAFFSYAEKFGIDSYLEGRRNKQWKNFFNGILNCGIVPRMRGKRHGGKIRKRK